jgi:biotin carboxyl carrier protein
MSVEEKAEERVQQVVRETKELIKMLETTSVRRISLEAGSFKIEIERAFAKGSRMPADTIAATEPRAEVGVAKSGHHQILSPLVGTFYQTPSPGAKPFVEAGSRVQVGETIGIIEVMKVMNEVKSDVAGIVIEILVQNGHPVQYEQPLMEIDTASA